MAGTFKSQSSNEENNTEDDENINMSVNDNHGEIPNSADGVSMPLGEPMVETGVFEDTDAPPSYSEATANDANLPSAPNASAVLLPM